MFSLFILSLFCIGFTLFFYLTKSQRQAEPDYSHIIFKDYSTYLTQNFTCNDYKADKVEVEIEGVVKAEEKIENIKQEKEDILLPTLNFED